ncbi:MAG: hypothetical protein ACTTJD_03840, partial [Porphyromonadaceae bacterium]
NDTAVLHPQHGGVSYPPTFRFMAKRKAIWAELVSKLGEIAMQNRRNCCAVKTESVAISSQHTG